MMKEKILKMYNEGESVASIGRISSLSQYRVKKILEDEGMYVPQIRGKRKLIDWDEFRDYIIHTYANGSSTKDIAKYVGCKPNYHSV